MPRTFNVTHLINSLKIESTESKINIVKLSFMKRLLKNKITSAIVECKLKDKRLKEQNHSLVEKVIEILYTKSETTILDLEALCTQN